MYQTITFYHSLMRWLVLASLVYSIYRVYRGYKRNAIFTEIDNGVRHWTATIAHVQLVIGILFYTQSPIIKYFWSHFNEAVKNTDSLFFGLIHIIMMLIAIVIITIGSALSKRRTNDRDKFRTMLVWYGIALLIIIVAIPWPFSPLASRPYIR